MGALRGREKWEKGEGERGGREGGRERRGEGGSVAG